MNEREDDMVQRAKAGDGGALDRLFEAYAPALRSAIDANLSPEWRRLFDTDDVLVEALAEAYRSINAFEYRGPGSFLAWLKQIAMRDLTDEARKYLTAKREGERRTISGSTDSLVRFTAAIADSQQATPSQIVMREEAVKQAADAMSRLPGDQREAVQRCDLDGASVAEVAAAMAITPNHVRVLRCRAFGRLREALSDQASILRIV